MSEAAQRLGIAAYTCREYIKAKRLNALRIGVHTLRIENRELDRFLREARNAQKKRPRKLKGSSTRSAALRAVAPEAQEKDPKGLEVQP